MAAHTHRRMRTATPVFAVGSTVVFEAFASDYARSTQDLALHAMSLCGDVIAWQLPCFASAQIIGVGDLKSPEEHYIIGRLENNNLIYC